MVFNLSDSDSVARNFLWELRDIGIQKDRMRFRRNLERIGELLAYEISRTLAYTDFAIETPVQKVTVRKLSANPVLVTVLRAGLPFVNGFLNYFDQADTGYIGAFREEADQSISINLHYLAAPVLEGKAVILADPMLATGSSVVACMEALLRNSRPACIHLASVIAAPEGIERVSDYMRTKGFAINLWTAAIDQKLNDSFFIVPGLGDAGDLSFGSKI